MKTSVLRIRTIISTLFCCFLVLFGNAQVDLANGLVAWLPFTGNTQDASGNGNHGFATNGGLFTSDRFGQPVPLRLSVCPYGSKRTSNAFSLFWANVILAF
jgi:hypothetical protein